MEPVPLADVGDKRREGFGAGDDVTNGTQDTVLKQAEMQDKAGKRSKEKRMFALVLSSLNHILIVAFTIYILVQSFEKYSLFSWHPSCMTVGIFLLMSEAVMAISPDNILTTKLGRQQRVRVHWVLQALAAALIFAGFLVIVINKNLGNKPHFQTVHAILGLITVILLCVTSLGGVFALYSVKFRHLISPVTVKLIHNIVGIVTFFIGALCLVMSLYSNWAMKFGNITRTAWRVIVIFSAFKTLEGPIQSAYIKIKNKLTKP